MRKKETNQKEPEAQGTNTTKYNGMFVSKCCNEIHYFVC